MERLNLTLEDGTKEKLARLAGGERRIGGYLSDLVAAMDERGNTSTPVDYEQLSYALNGLIGTVKMIEGRLLQVENRLRQEKN